MTAADLAAAVKARRTALAWSQAALAETARVSLRTVARIEGGRCRKLTGATSAGVDRALGWTAGSAGGLLVDGEPPTVVAVPPPPAVASSAWRCPDCGRRGTCAKGSCTDRRVVVRRILVDHLTAQMVRTLPFAELIEALLDDLVPQEVRA